MDVRYIQASKLKFDPRPQMGEIFAEGFKQWLLAFSKDTVRLAKAFAHVFDLRCFYLAVHGDKVIAMAGIGNGGSSPIKFDKKICRKELGFFRGWVAYIMLTKYIVNHKYPFDFSPGMGSIETVVTATKFRGKGIAYGLLNHVMKVTPYGEYVLEVIESNVGAIKLYEKLGFKVFNKTKDPNSRHSGITAFLYMKPKVS